MAANSKLMITEAKRRFPAHIRPQITDRLRLVCRRYERKA
jgi:hypothetical protein